MGNKIDIDDVRGQHQALIKRRQVLDAEMEMLVKAASEIDESIKEYETAMKILSHHETKSSSWGDDDDAGNDASANHGEIRRLIEQTLHMIARNGSTVAEIREYIQLRSGRDIQPNTISVTLNRLKSRQLARLSGLKWFPGPEVEVFSAAAGLHITEASDLDDDVPF